MPAHSPEETHALIAAALNAADPDAIAEVYEDDAVLVVPPAGRHARGREAIRAAIEPMLALGPSARLEVVGKLEADGLALTLGRWTIVGSERGERLELSGRGAIVSRRQADGSWRVVLDHPMGLC